jgi:protein TonB
MKIRRKKSMNAVFKWLAIMSMIAIVIAIMPSCKGKTKPSESTTDEVAPPPPTLEPFNINDGDTIWFRADENPKFAGGDAALSKFFAENIVYPEAAKKNKTEGRVVVTFVVTKEGAIRDAKVIKGVDPELDKEALKLVNSLPAFEKPAMVNGKPVNFHHTLPVIYALH